MTEDAFLRHVIAYARPAARLNAFNTSATMPRRSRESLKDRAVMRRVQ